MRGLKTLVISSSFLLMGFDTYYIRVPIDQTQTKQSVSGVVSSKGSKTSKQPFMETHTLVQPDTNYILVTITPEDSVEESLAKTGFGLGGDIYQVWRLDENGMNLITDNSEKYPVDKVWPEFTVGKST